MDALIKRVIPIEKYIVLPILIHSISCGTGTPIDDNMSEEEYSDFYLKLAKDPKIFKAKGDSMSPLIKSGHRVLIDRANKNPKNDDIVAAELNGVLTIKIYREDSGLVYLAPFNPQYKAFPINETDDFNIVGVVVYLIDEDVQ